MPLTDPKFSKIPELHISYQFYKGKLRVHFLKNVLRSVNIRRMDVEKWMIGPWARIFQFRSVSKLSQVSDRTSFWRWTRFWRSFLRPRPASPLKPTSLSRANENRMCHKRARVGQFWHKHGFGVFRGLWNWKEVQKRVQRQKLTLRQRGNAEQ